MHINQITRENFQESFDLLDILKNSVFYPASGIDAIDIEEFSSERFFGKFVSFVHVDYTMFPQDVNNAMTNDFVGLGYNLIGIRQLEYVEIFPNDFRSLSLTLNLQEIEQKEQGRGQNIVPFFAFWAVYEFIPQPGRPILNRLPRFQLLHIGGEACHVFEAIYLYNKINPRAIISVRQAAGYGDNWTNFLNPDFRLYRLLLRNANKNCTTMPNFVLTSASVNWPSFEVVYSFREMREPDHYYGSISLYKRRILWNEYILSILKKYIFKIFRL
ncbi:MAG: hypothetical protein ACKOAV_00630 [Bacteroidota bacterium]